MANIAGQGTRVIVFYDMPVRREPDTLINVGSQPARGLPRSLPVFRICLSSRIPCPIGLKGMRLGLTAGGVRCVLILISVHGRVGLAEQLDFELAVSPPPAVFLCEEPARRRGSPLPGHCSGHSRGTKYIAMAKRTRTSGPPTRTKSKNLYLPGPYTIRHAGSSGVI